MSIYIAVCGPGDATPHEEELAEAVGREIAKSGAVLVCGGLGGAMDAAARGAAAAGGISVGILPGITRDGASDHLTAALVTGMGEARNALVVRSADAIIAVAGGFGTLSEMALALKMGKPVVGLGTWRLSPGEGPEPPDPVMRADSPEQAVLMALRAAHA